MPLKLGLVIPPLEGGFDGRTPRWADVLSMATLAEAVGFDSIWIPDHLLVRLKGFENGWWECSSLLAALAASTRRITLASNVFSTAFRNPALLAKVADTIDEISGGRFLLGLGAGYHDPEFTAFGYPTNYKVARFEEAVSIIHSLLRTGKADVDGTYYQVRECELRPRGPRPQGPPILIGGTGPRVLRVAARYGDLWNTNLYRTRSHPDEIPPLRERVDEACRLEARDPTTLERTVGVLVATDVSAERDPRLSEPITGSPDEVAAVLRAFEAAGIAHLTIQTQPVSLTNIEACAPILEATRRH